MSCTPCSALHTFHYFTFLAYFPRPPDRLRSPHIAPAPTAYHTYTCNAHCTLHIKRRRIIICQRVAALCSGCRLFGRRRWRPRQWRPVTVPPRSMLSARSTSGCSGSTRCREQGTGGDGAGSGEQGAGERRRRSRELGADGAGSRGQTETEQGADGAGSRRDQRTGFREQGAD